MSKIALFDLSGIFRSAWHATEHQEIGEAFRRTVKFVHDNAHGFDAVGVCIDKPPYKRREMYSAYKAQREEVAAALYEQQRAVIERLDGDGLHIFGADGYEADDVIATITAWAKTNAHEVTIYSADKDMMQLVGDGTKVISTATKVEYGSVEVPHKFGVPPDRIPDWLALVGDKSDNIPGINGCGQKTAAAWLAEYGSLKGVLDNVDKLTPERFRPLVDESRELLMLSLKLTTLMTDAPINPEKIMEEKETKPTTSTTMTIDAELEPAQSTVTAEPSPQQPKALARIEPAAPVEWERALEPRSFQQAWDMSNMLFKSRLFGDFRSPEAILAIITTGRSLGMPAVASCRGFHVIKGKVATSAQVMVGLVKRSSSCEYFRLVDSDENGATWETKRHGEPEPTRLRYTYADAQRAGLAKLDQWQKQPGTMCRWRCATNLARAVYADVVSGLYSKEELEEM